MSSAGCGIPGKSLGGQLVMCLNDLYDPETDLKGQICVFAIESTEEVPCDTQESVTARVWALAKECHAGGARACLCILPKDMENFKVEAPIGAPADEVNALRSVCFGTIMYSHGEKLRDHVSELQNQRIAAAPDGLPDEVRNWKQCQAEWTGRPYYEHTKNGEKRWPPPIVLPQTEATLVYVGQDLFLSRLAGLLEYTPKGIIICHQSWRPDVEMVDIPKEQFDLDALNTPIVQVTYEAGEELKNVCASGASPHVTMEVQDFGGVFAWGNGTEGQLGLAGIENREFLDRSKNALTDYENKFAVSPCYVAHLHEHQVNSIACGFQHTVAVTKQGEVFAWGAPDGLGVSADTPSEAPMFVDQLEGLVRATKTFAGAHHSFVTADMPFKSLV